MAELHERAKALQKTIVFAEAGDVRVRDAAAAYSAAGFGTSVLVDPPPDATLAADLQVVEHQAADLHQRCATFTYQRRKQKGATERDAAAAARNPLLFAALLGQSGFG